MACGSAFLRPLGPKRFGFIKRRLRVEGCRRRQVRIRVGEHKRYRFAGRDRELANGLHILDILADEVHRGPQQNHFRAGDSAQRPIVEPRDPRHDRAVPETQHKLGVHDDVATLTAAIDHIVSSLA